MELNESTRGDITILQLSGTMHTGPDLAPLHERIKSLASGGTRHVVLDCSEVRSFSSAMFGVLAASLMTLRCVNGDLKLAGAPRALREALILCRLDEVFDIVPSADEAVDGFTDQTVGT